MKKMITISLCMALLMTIFTGCSSKKTSSVDDSNKIQKEIPSLTGEWKQENSESKDSYQVATINADNIEIYWVTDNGDTKSLYWSGSFTAPITTDEPYSWDSKNDHSKTESALLASSDDTKTITYQDDVLSYEVSAMGTTTKVKLKKQQ